MRIRKKPWAEPELAACDYYIKNPREYRGRWITVFDKPQPVYLELGCGKGGFAAQQGLRHPNINFLAVDIKSDMLGVGRRNISSAYEREGKAVTNIKLICQNIEQIDLLFSSQDKIERIYINFCNPWPREKHKKRRLTYPKKLAMYREFLVDSGEIHFKTDDDPLFFESLEYFKECGFLETYKTLDLHNSGYRQNIMTEHEKMFSDEGVKIKFCIMKKV